MPNQRNFRRLIRALPNCMVLMFDRDFRYEFAAGEALERFGYDGDDMIGRTGPEVLGDRWVRVESMYQATVSGEELYVVYPTETTHYGIHAVPLTEGDEVVGGAIFAIDVTKQETAMRDLEASNRELERFTYVASHDLQGPLRVINSFAELLQNHLSDTKDDSVDAYLNHIMRGTRRMKNLINALLKYSRAGRKNTQPDTTVDIRDLISNRITELLPDRSVSDVLEYSGEETLHGDPVALDQIFSNFVSNSVKYARESVPVQLKVNVQCADDSDTCIVTFEDNGIGIPDTYGKDIFDVFERLHSEREYSGTGIGLSIVKKIVEGQGGSVRFENLDRGVRFEFDWPSKNMTHGEGG